MQPLYWLRQVSNLLHHQGWLDWQFFSLECRDFRYAQELVLIKHYIFDILGKLLNDKLTTVLESYLNNLEVNLDKKNCNLGSQWVRTVH